MADKPKPNSQRGLAPANVILGVDPGLRRTGYAFLRWGAEGGRPTLVEAGVIRLRPADSLPARLVELGREIDALIDTHRPAALACEALYAHYKHPRTAILMGHARGVILAAAGARGIDVLSVAATNVKKLVTGSGRAGKRQMQIAVAATLGLAQLPEPHDVADAIAIALCGQRMWAATGAVRGVR